MPAIFNVKHLALADLIFLLMLILQIGNGTYFSGTGEISSWIGKLCSQKVKCYLQNALTMALGKAGVLNFLLYIISTLSSLC